MEPLDYIKKELESKGANHSGYDIPDGYFDSMESKILEQTIGRDKTSMDAPIRSISLPWKLTAIAASLALIIFSVTFINSNETSIDQFSMNEISEEDSYDLLMEDEIDMDTDDLLDLEGIDEILDELEKELIVKK